MGWILWQKVLWITYLWKIGNGFCDIKVCEEYMYEDLEMGVGFCDKDVVTRSLLENTCLRIRGWVLWHGGFWIIYLWRFGDGFCGTEIFEVCMCGGLWMFFVVHRFLKCIFMKVRDGCWVLWQKLLWYKDVWRMCLWRFGDGFCIMKAFGLYSCGGLGMGFVVQRFLEDICMKIWKWALWHRGVSSVHVWWFGRGFVVCRFLYYIFVKFRKWVLW